MPLRLVMQWQDAIRLCILLAILARRSAFEARELASARRAVHRHMLRRVS